MIKDGLYISFIEYTTTQMPSGPILVKTYYNCWHKDGKIHRLNKPAFYFIDSEKNEIGWYYKGRNISCSSIEEFHRLIKLELLW